MVKGWVTDAGLAIAFAALAWIGVAWSRDGGPIAALWLPNAMLLGMLLQRERQSLRPFLLCFVANLATNIAAGIPEGVSLLRGVANMAEIAIVLLGTRAGRDLETMPQLARFTLIGGLLAPFASGALVTLGDTLMTGRVSLALWFGWVAAHGLGMLVVAPLIGTLTESWRQREGLTRRRTIEAAAIGVAALAVTGALFAQSRYPLLFLAGPIVMVAALRIGLLGATVTTVVTGAVAAIATGMGYGPITLVQGGLQAKLLVLQLFVAVNFVMGLPVAAILRGLNETRERLRTSRDFAQSMLLNMNEVIFRSDGSTLAYLNPAWETITGYGVADTLGDDLRAYVHADDLPAFNELWEDLRTGAIDRRSAALRLVHRTGRIIHAEMSASGLRDLTDVPVAVTGSIRDVTERVLFEGALRDSERRFQTLADLAPVGIFRTDAAGALTYANRAWADLAGMAPHEAEGNGWSRAVHAADRAGIGAGWTRAVASQQAFRAEFRFEHHDGTLIWVDTMTGVERDAAGQVVGHIGVNLDVTERTRAVAALAESEGQLSLLASNATDAVFRLALDGTCLYASPSVEGVIGTQPARVIGRSMLARFHPDDDASVRAAFADLARGAVDKMVISWRTEPVDQPGSWRWLEANCGLVRSADTGAPEELIVSIRDIGTRKELELALAGARDAAEVAARAKANFLADMSHEIRTPMNGVIGATELLLDGELAPTQRAQAQVIADSGRAMMRLLNDILDLSKIDAGQMQVADEAVDLRHALRGCVKLMAPLATQKGLVLELAVDPTLPARVAGDGLRLRQIVLNLVGNAIKFTAAGGVTIAAHANAAGQIEIEVRDTGIGIAPERQRAVFDQFVQSDTGTARRYGGTGLGLAISAQLAQLMQGDLSLASVPGEGSSFYLRLPLRAVSSKAAEAAHPEAVAGSEAPALDGLRVLLAEDHEINRMLATAMLERFGAQVTCAVDGAAAILAVEGAIAADTPFSLVLMDMQMPDVDGLEATRRLRAAGHSPAALPIVALTANAYADDIDLCMAAGMQAHLAKPLRLAELRGALERWSGNARAGVAIGRQRSG